MIKRYFGCECFCLNHISLMTYFPPEEDDDEVIYFTVKTGYLYKRVLPCFNPINWIDDFGYYLQWHILKRIPIGLAYIFHKDYARKEGVLDCFDFDNNALPEIKEFLSNLTDEESKEIEFNKKDLISYVKQIRDKYIFHIDNQRWRIRFVVWRLDEDMPYWLGWEIQFIPRKLLGRIRYALKYIFGRVDDEQEFEINKDDAARLKGLITVVRKINEEDKRTEPKN